MDKINLAKLAIKLRYSCSMRKSNDTSHRRATNIYGKAFLFLDFSQVGKSNKRAGLRERMSKAVVRVCKKVVNAHENALHNVFHRRAERIIFPCKMSLLFCSVNKYYCDKERAVCVWILFYTRRAKITIYMYRKNNLRCSLSKKRQNWFLLESSYTVYKNIIRKAVSEWSGH